MAKEIARRSRDVPAARTGDTDPDGYAGMPIVIQEDPDWAVPMPPETAPFGTVIQRYWRYVVVGPRYLAYWFLRATTYWYTAAALLISAVTILIIFVTR